MKAKRNANRYAAIVERVFASRYRPGTEEVPFKRDDLVAAARQLRIAAPRNIADILYSVRYRNALPDAILQTQPRGREWVIEGSGKSTYVFRLVSVNRIRPNRTLDPIKIPDSTPEIVAAYALSDEQAVLAKVRYNRLVDIFLGATAYSLQNHLRTSVTGVGQIEVDELYVAVDKRGCQFIVPIQAKGGADELSSVQTRQDVACCREKFPALQCRAVSAQFVDDDRIAMFELIVRDGDVRIVEERHYRLVPADAIAPEDLAAYASH